MRAGRVFSQPHKSLLGNTQAESDTRTWAVMDSDHPPSFSCGGGVSLPLSLLCTAPPPPRQPFANRIIPRHPSISQTMNERASERARASASGGRGAMPARGRAAAFCGLLRARLVEECLPSKRTALDDVRLSQSTWRVAWSLWCNQSYVE